MSIRLQDAIDLVSFHDKTELDAIRRHLAAVVRELHVERTKTQELARQNMQLRIMLLSNMPVVATVVQTACST